MLGSSRGGHDTQKIVDAIETRQINQVGDEQPLGTGERALFFFECW